MGTSSTIQSTWMMTMMQYSTGSMLTTTTTACTMTQGKTTGTSFLVRIVSTMTMTETMQMQTMMASIKRFGTAVR